MHAKIAIIILAAGASRRFNGDKLLTFLGGRRLIDWSVNAAVASELAPVLVITNPNRNLEKIDPSVSIVVNDIWQAGLSSSICCGLNVLSTTPCQAAIFAPGDQPLLVPDVYRRIADRFLQKSSCPIVASYDGRARNPVLLPRHLWTAASRIEGDIGLAALVRSAEAELVECGDIASIADVDCFDDVQALEKILLQK